jgi:flagellar FliL protein
MGVRKSGFACLIPGAGKAETMAEDVEDEIDADDEAEGAEGGDEKKGGLKKLLLFVGLPVVILLLGGVAGGLLLLGGGDEQSVAEGEHGEHGEGGAHGDAPSATAVERYAALHTWPSDGGHTEIDVNIEAEDGRMLVMQLGFVFVYEDAELDALLAQDVIRQRLRTSFVEFLRTLRAEDIYGSMGTFRIRAEMRRRANLELAPYEIEDVLIPELIIA